MLGDYCAIKTITVEVQQNGIIRNKAGNIIARLCEGIKFEEVEEPFIKKWEVAK